MHKLKQGDEAILTSNFIDDKRVTIVSMSLNNTLALIKDGETSRQVPYSYLKSI